MFLNSSLFLRLRRSLSAHIFVGTVHKNTLQIVCNIPQWRSCIDYLYFFKVQNETNKHFKLCEGIQTI